MVKISTMRGWKGRGLRKLRKQPRGFLNYGKNGRGTFRRAAGGAGLRLDHPLEDQKAHGEEYHIKSYQKTQPRDSLLELSGAQEDLHAADGGEDDRDHEREENERQQKLPRPRLEGHC